MQGYRQCAMTGFRLTLCHGHVLVFTLHMIEVVLQLDVCQTIHYLQACVGSIVLDLMFLSREFHDIDDKKGT